ncbi:hypothetical protein H2204_000832 [Knufia peltigerae]|uniref:Dipeptidase n=1 Tax=Knufia peltigerae TaxID=1002370 RepID=A0AA39D4J7_9EURO|nr:hypothetical protein H2204_000832 [Knufia peltigerae]
MLQSSGDLLLFFVYVASLAVVVDASYAFYVGSSLTASGDILIGGSGEEVSGHWLQIFPAAEHAANETITVGVTDEAVLPGRLITIPQVSHTHRYISMEYSDYWGLPAPLTNGGLNDRGVAVRDVWAPNRRELVDMTPDPQTGVNYSNLARLVMERARSARHAVEIIGELIREHGYATYGGNTHLVADRDEAWVVWEFAGGRKLWAAERLRPDEVRVLYPGYIGDFPVDFERDPENYMGAPHLVTFAQEQGWWSSRASKTPSLINLVEVYGLAQDDTSPVGGGVGRVSHREMEEATLKKVPVTEQDLMSLVRDPRMSTDEAGYGQVVRLPKDSNMDPDLRRIWIAPTGSVAAPFVPWWLGVQSVPPEFGQHRYLLKEASSTFLNPGFQLQEASLFAGRLFKRVLYYMCSAPRLFRPLVQDMLVGFESQSLRDVEWVERTGEILVSAARRKEGGTDEAGRDLLHKLLTHYTHSRASHALELGSSIVDALDGYIKMTGGWRDPVSGDKRMNLPADEEGINCLLLDEPDSFDATTTPPPPLAALQQNQRPLTRAAKAFERFFGGS